MIRIENPQRALCALLLSLVLSACEMSARPVSVGFAEAAPMAVSTIGWPEPAPYAVVDGVELYN